METTCKMCQKKIEVEIDPEYEGLGDPYKLIRMATCNPCADVQDKRRRIEDKICTLAYGINHMSRDDYDKAIIILERLIRKLISLAADWRRAPFEAHFDPEIVRQLIDNPREARVVLKQVWLMR